MARGEYEIVLQGALEKMGPGPWRARDLHRARETLTQEFCSAFDRQCDQDAVLDWLSALPPHEVADLLDRLNAGREEAE